MKVVSVLPCVLSQQPSGIEGREGGRMLYREGEREGGVRQPKPERSKRRRAEKTGK